eukprot:366229-Chlamydomonas_euryale.AAC.15
MMHGANHTIQGRWTLRANLKSPAALAAAASQARTPVVLRQRRSACRRGSGEVRQGLHASHWLFNMRGKSVVLGLPDFRLACHVNCLSADDKHVHGMDFDLLRRAGHPARTAQASASLIEALLWLALAMTKGILKSGQELKHPANIMYLRFVLQCSHLHASNLPLGRVAFSLVQSVPQGFHLFELHPFPCQQDAREHAQRLPKQLLYIQMEFCSRTLQQALQAGPVTEEEAWQIVRGILAGLAYIHSQRIIHRQELEH